MTEAKKQAADLPWITDRVPTAEDAETDGCVITTGNSRFSSWSYDCWQDVKLGTPWLAYSPPRKPEKEIIHQQTTTKPEELSWVPGELPDSVSIFVEPFNPDQFQWKPRSKSLARKFVSIAANTLGSGDFYVLYAVADDGTAWRYEAWRHEDKWKQLPALPDRDA